MTIVSMTFSVKTNPRHRKIMFEGTDSGGKKYEIGPIITTDPDYDPSAVSNLMIDKLNEDLIIKEISLWLENTDLLFIGDFATPQRHASTWRAAYKNAVGLEHFRLGFKMHVDVLAGSFSNPQLRTAWDLTQAELTAFLGRIETAHDHFVLTQVGVGE